MQGFIIEKIQKAIDKEQVSQAKKIHLIDFTEEEFEEELAKPNNAFIEAVKEGVVLFGQENFIRFIKNKILQER